MRRHTRRGKAVSAAIDAVFLLGFLVLLASSALVFGFVFAIVPHLLFGEPTVSQAFMLLGMMFGGFFFLLYLEK